MPHEGRPVQENHTWQVSVSDVAVLISVFASISVNVAAVYTGVFTGTIFGNITVLVLCKNGVISFTVINVFFYTGVAICVCVCCCC